MLKSANLEELVGKYLNRLLRTFVIVVHRSNEHKFVFFKGLL